MVNRVVNFLNIKGYEWSFSAGGFFWDYILKNDMKNITKKKKRMCGLYLIMLSIFQFKIIKIGGTAVLL